MALQKTYTIRGGVSVTDCYHDIVSVNIDKISALLYVYIYKDSGSSSDIANKLDEKAYRIVDDPSIPHTDFTDYFDTVHATDNVMKRGESYLKDKDIDGYYGNAVVV